MSAKRERITRLYLPDCPWGPRCQEERRTLSVSSLRSTCWASEGSVRPSWMRPGASWKGHGWACPWEPVEKSSSNTPVATRILRIFLLFFIIHSLPSLFLSFRRFHFFLIFLLGVFSSFAMESPSILIDFTALWKSLELDGLKENRYDDVWQRGYTLVFIMET